MSVNAIDGLVLLVVLFGVWRVRSSPGVRLRLPTWVDEIRAYAVHDVSMDASTSEQRKADIGRDHRSMPSALRRRLTPDGVP